MKYTQVFAYTFVAIAAASPIHKETREVESGQEVTKDDESTKGKFPSDVPESYPKDTGYIEFEPSESNALMGELQNLLDVVVQDVEDVAYVAGYDPEDIFDNTGITVAKRSVKRSQFEEERLMKRGFGNVVETLVTDVVGAVNNVGEVSGVSVVDTVLSVLGA